MNTDESSEYIPPQLKEIHMTDDYAAQYYHKNGYMWARLEVMKNENTWGKLSQDNFEKKLREEIAKEIESHMPHGKMCDITLALSQAAKIARGGK